MMVLGYAAHFLVSEKNFQITKNTGLRKVVRPCMGAGGGPRNYPTSYICNSHNGTADFLVHHIHAFTIHLGKLLPHQLANQTRAPPANSLAHSLLLLWGLIRETTENESANEGFYQYLYVFLRISLRISMCIKQL